MTARCLTMAALQTDWDKVPVRGAAHRGTRRELRAQAGNLRPGGAILHRCGVLAVSFRNQKGSTWRSQVPEEF